MTMTRLKMLAAVTAGALAFAAAPSQGQELPGKGKDRALRPER